jgi:hypothetical protein
MGAFNIAYGHWQLLKILINYFKLLLNNFFNYYNVLYFGKILKFKKVFTFPFHS